MTNQTADKPDAGFEEWAQSKLLDREQLPKTGLYRDNKTRLSHQAWQARQPEIDWLKRQVEAAYREGYAEAKGEYGVIENFQNHAWNASKAKRDIATADKIAKE